MKLTKPVHLNPDCHLWVRLLVYHCTRVSVSHFIYYLLPFCLFLDLSFYVIYIYVFIPLFYLSTIYLCVGLSLFMHLSPQVSKYLSFYVCIYQISVCLCICVIHIFICPLSLSPYYLFITHLFIYKCIYIRVYNPLSSICIPIFLFHLHTRLSALQTLAPCFLHLAHLRDLQELPGSLL